MIDAERRAVDSVSTQGRLLPRTRNTGTLAGSLRYDADPTGVLRTPPGRLALTPTDPSSFAAAIQDVLTVWDGHRHRRRLPSRCTPFDDGHVWAEGGWEWVALDPHVPDPRAAITTATRTHGGTGCLPPHAPLTHPHLGHPAP